MQVLTTKKLNQERLVIYPENFVHEVDLIQKMINDSIALIFKKKLVNSDNKILKKTLNCLCRILVNKTPARSEDNKVKTVAFGIPITKEDGLLFSQARECIEEKSLPPEDILLRFIEALAETGHPYAKLLAARKWHNALLFSICQNYNNKDTAFPIKLFSLGKWLIGALKPVHLDKAIDICETLVHEKALSNQEALDYFNDLCQEAIGCYGNSPPMETILSRLSTLAESFVEQIDHVCVIPESLTKSLEWLHACICQSPKRLFVSNLLLKGFSKKNLIPYTLLKICLNQLDTLDKTNQIKRLKVALFILRNSSVNEIGSDLDLSNFSVKSDLESELVNLLDCAKENRLDSSQINFFLERLAKAGLSHHHKASPNGSLAPLEDLAPAVSLSTRRKKRKKKRVLKQIVSTPHEIAKAGASSSTTSRSSKKTVEPQNFSLPNSKTPASKVTINGLKKTTHPEVTPQKRNHEKISDIPDLNMVLEKKEKFISTLEGVAKACESINESIEIAISILENNPTDISLCRKTVESSIVCTNDKLLEKLFKILSSIPNQKVTDTNASDLFALWYLALPIARRIYSKEVLLFLIKNQNYFFKIFTFDKVIEIKQLFHDLVFRMCLLITSEHKGQDDIEEILSLSAVVIEQYLKKLNLNEITPSILEELKNFCSLAVKSKTPEKFSSLYLLIHKIGHPDINYLEYGCMIGNHPKLQSECLTFLQSACPTHESNLDELSENPTHGICLLLNQLIPTATVRDLILISCFLDTHPQFKMPNRLFASTFHLLILRKFFFTDQITDPTKRIFKRVLDLKFFKKHFNFLFSLQRESVCKVLQQCLSLYTVDHSFVHFQNECLKLGSLLKNTPDYFDLLILMLSNLRRKYPQFDDVIYLLLRKFVFLTKEPSKNSCTMMQKYTSLLSQLSPETNKDFFLKVVQNPLMLKNGTFLEYGQFMNLVAEVALETPNPNNLNDYDEAFKLFLEIQDILAKEGKWDEEIIVNAYEICLNLLKKHPKEKKLQTTFYQLEACLAKIEAESLIQFQEYISIFTNLSIVENCLLAMEESPDCLATLFQSTWSNIVTFLTFSEEKVPLHRLQEFIDRLFFILGSRISPTNNFNSSNLQKINEELSKKVFFDNPASTLMHALAIDPSSQVSIHNKCKQIENCPGLFRGEFKKYIDRLIAKNRAEPLAKACVLLQGSYRNIFKEFSDEYVECFQKVILASKNKFLTLIEGCPLHQWIFDGIFMQISLVEPPQSPATIKGLELNHVGSPLCTLLSTLIEECKVELKHNSEETLKLVLSCFNYLKRGKKTGVFNDDLLPFFVIVRNLIRLSRSVPEIPQELLLNYQVFFKNLKFKDDFNRRYCAETIIDWLTFIDPEHMENANQFLEENSIIDLVFQDFSDLIQKAKELINKNNHL